MSEEFQVLAAKLLAREITVDERARFEALLADNPALREEWAALQSAWRTVADLEPLAQSLVSPPSTIPNRRLVHLLGTVQGKLPASCENLGGLPDESRLAPESGSGGKRNPGAKSSSFWESIGFPWLSGLRLGSAVGVVAVVFLLVWVLAPTVPETPSSRMLEARAPLAFLIVHRGNPEVARASGTVPATSGTSLHLNDQVQLASEDQVTIFGREGRRRIQGPTQIPITPSWSTRGFGAPDGEFSENAQYPRKPLEVLFTAAGELDPDELLLTTRSLSPIRLYSPLGATASDRPTLLWKADPGRTYDVRITDELDSTVPPWDLTQVSPPVVFASVDAWRSRPLRQGNHLYRIRVSEFGRPLTTVEHTFRTIEAEATAKGTDALGLEEVYEILMNEGERTGDALAQLLLLPPPVADSEFALRLELLAFGKLGYTEDFNRVLDRLRAIR